MVLLHIVLFSFPGTLPYGRNRPTLQVGRIRPFVSEMQSMSKYQQMIVVGVIMIVGICGCSQSSSGSPEKMKAMEAKVNRLEEEFRAATAARDQLRKKLAEVEQEQAQLKQERDELRNELKTRTAERDSVSGQFDQFRKSLKELIGQTEAALAKPNKPIMITVGSPKPNL
jgi:septal ring factor EnvC (AmiA/AmiB activator)